MNKIAVLILSLMVIGCGRDNASNHAVAGLDVPVTVTRNTDFAQVTRGGRLFQANCAKCHGDQAQGDPNWRYRDAEGMFPPPPLDGTAHAWHHPLTVLKQVIANGSPPGQGRMPAWGAKLSEQEIEDVIAWFQAKWPDEVYTAWYTMDQRSRQQ